MSSRPLRRFKSTEALPAGLLSVFSLVVLLKCRVLLSFHERLKEKDEHRSRDELAGHRRGPPDRVQGEKMEESLTGLMEVLAAALPVSTKTILQPTKILVLYVDEGDETINCSANEGCVLY